jgi:type I restriction enzyme R subunit
MSDRDHYSEDALVEQPAIALLDALGWTTVNAHHETFGPEGTLGRDNRGEVVLRYRLDEALRRLNPDASEEALGLAIDELTRDRTTLSLVQANREVYELLKDGVKVTYHDEEEGEVTEVVRVIEWDQDKVENNDFLLVSQLWVAGELYTRRADLVGFINGLPLLFIELKAAHRTLQDAYRKNLRDYKDTIPHLFHYNALIVLSNGGDSRVGSITAGWEHFSEWKRVESEEEEAAVSLERVLRGVAEPRRSLDIAENFVLFQEVQGGVVKIAAKNHQVLGVNNAIEAVQHVEANKGRLGVFWHTQGSGKSFSMVFFSQKVLRKMHGNWSFVVVTDRTDLDEQIYKTFVSTGAVGSEEEAQAGSGSHLRQLLREDHRYVFTLIQKFQTSDDAPYPTLSERDDVIVMVDEAHRTQYDTLAQNMRLALPNAAFLAFTGTPLLAGEEKTREVFGDYVSVYNFRQSIADEATVPLYYENRIPELQLKNENLNEDILRVIEEAGLDEEQERKLERLITRQYHLITRDDRLDRIAEDLVQHFLDRGYQGKAMVVSIDKATALRMYNKVQRAWEDEKERVQRELALLPVGDPAEEALRKRLAYMEETDMAVVVSQAQGEVADMAEKGIDILPHRRRIHEEDLETKFKNPDDPFRIVFVCAMWMTGFDVPNCSTIYLDKPLRNHTLMQTIARANRVYPGKQSGLIVDYVGVFRNLQEALALYGSGSGGGVEEGDTPVQNKTELLQELVREVERARAFLSEHGVDPEAIRAAEGFDRVRLLQDAVDALVATDTTKEAFLNLSRGVDALFKAVLPDPAAAEYGPLRKLLVVLAEGIRSLREPVDISEVLASIEEVLDRSISAEGYVIAEPGAALPDTTEDPAVPYRADGRVDLSEIDFDALRERFEQGHKHIEAEKLKARVQRKLRQMVRQNRARLDYLKRFQDMIENYNMGSQNVEAFFQQMLAFMQELGEEEQRPAREGLSEEELAVFDLIQPEGDLSEEDREAVKQVARETLAAVQKVLVLDWRKKQQARAGVRLAIRKALNKLPESYDRAAFMAAYDALYQHVYEAYPNVRERVYGRSAGA